MGRQGTVVHMAHRRIGLEIALQQLKLQGSRKRNWRLAQPDLGVFGHRPSGRGDTTGGGKRSTLPKLRGMAQVSVARSGPRTNGQVQAHGQLASRHMDRLSHLLRAQAQRMRHRSSRAQGGPVAIDVHALVDAQARPHTGSDFVSDHQGMQELPIGQARRHWHQCGHNRHTRATVCTGMTFAGLIPACCHGQHHGSIRRRQTRLGIARAKETAGVSRCRHLRHARHRLCAQACRDAPQGVQHQPTGTGLQRGFSIQIQRVQAFQNTKQLSIHTLSISYPL